ncbi:MAG: tetratricopeptide repeat protein, partial [Bacteroidia bacterium]|nr:tetratricopeptide repeat protein [Bacteroidia bacterium]
MPLNEQKINANKLFAVIFSCFLFFLNTSFAQENKIKIALTKLSKSTTVDTNRVQIYADLAFFYHTVNADSTLFYARKAKNDALRLKYKKGLADAYKLMAIAHYVKSEGDTAIKLNNLALKMYSQLGDLKGQGAVLNNIAIIYHNTGRYDEAILTHKKGL